MCVLIYKALRRAVLQFEHNCRLYCKVIKLQISVKRFLSKVTAFFSDAKSAIASPYTIILVSCPDPPEAGHETTIIHGILSCMYYNSP